MRLILFFIFFSIFLFGQQSQNKLAYKYYINGELAPSLNLASGQKYIFDQNDSTASKHPISFSTTKNGTHNGGVSKTEGIRYFGNGYEGTEEKFSSLFSNESSPENAFVVFEPSSSDTLLYYYCLFHGGMANDAKILIDGFVEQVPEVVATTITVKNN